MSHIYSCVCSDGVGCEMGFSGTGFGGGKVGVVAVWRGA